ncbi:hypothetical protein RHGRI_007701 [Rhododendron griersonianum]|uniref:Uncharacterized protein n=1 Tax=Rhododendron griersonianum TaxID=479676 RepID=A0AAV6KZM5_9ERIC|nr:hypothetical protein RHGRI_007701 [Rhododendron griersonianum]
MAAAAPPPPPSPAPTYLHKTTQLATRSSPESASPPNPTSPTSTSSSTKWPSSSASPTSSPPQNPLSPPPSSIITSLLPSTPSPSSSSKPPPLPSPKPTTQFHTHHQILHLRPPHRRPGTRPFQIGRKQRRRRGRVRSILPELLDFPGETRVLHRGLVREGVLQEERVGEDAAVGRGGAGGEDRVREGGMGGTRLECECD